MRREINLKNIGTNFITLLIALMAIYLMFSMVTFNEKVTEKQVDNISEIIKNAAIQCYALEGSYPPDVYYLADNYGVIIDESLYIYYYEIYGSNIMPEIKIFAKE